MTARPENRWHQDAERDEIPALEWLEQEIALDAARSFLCSVIAVTKFGDRIATAYQLNCDRTGLQFWIWGVGTPATLFEIRRNFARQIAANLGAPC